MSAYWQFQATGTVYPERFVIEAGKEKEVARPVVVIDPEDAVQVVRLVALFWANSNEDLDDPAAMTLALREFASPTPAKPDEPTGLGAVVEDTDGYHWVSAVHENRDRWYNPLQGGWRDYAHVDAIAVLSPGMDRRVRAEA